MSNRREFLKQSTSLLGLSTLDFVAPTKPLLSFSTLGCPAWTFSQVLQHASANRYDGIEIRGIKGDLDLPNNPLFSASNIASTRREAENKKLKIVMSNKRDIVVCVPATRDRVSLLKLFILSSLRSLLINSNIVKDN